MPLATALSQNIRVVLGSSGAGGAKQEFVVPASNIGQSATSSAVASGVASSSAAAAATVASDGNSEPARVVAVQEDSKELIDEIVALKDQLEPLEERKAQIDAVAARRAQRVVWYGAAGLCAQWAFLARLTW